jgi:hypothetical protein
LDDLEDREVGRRATCDTPLIVLGDVVEDDTACSGDYTVNGCRSHAQGVYVVRTDLPERSRRVRRGSHRERRGNQNGDDASARIDGTSEPYPVEQWTSLRGNGAARLGESYRPSRAL